MNADRGPKAVLTSSAWQTYKRLLSYVKPHRAMFLLGVLGAVLFATSMNADTVAKFTPLVSNYLGKLGGPSVQTMLAGALK